MILKFLSQTLRHILRYRTYSFLNIIGLSIGMACAMLIILWADNELKTDKYNVNGDRVYILRKQMKFSDGQITIDPSITGPLAPAISSEVPEVEAAVRVSWPWRMLFRVDEKAIYQQGFYVDSSFFKAFPDKFVFGSTQTAFTHTNSVVISKKLSQKFFGDKNPVGKTITIRDKQEQLFTVTGVFDDLPKTSSIEYDFLIPFTKYLEYYKDFVRWGNYNVMTLVLAKPNTDPKLLSQKIDAVLKKNDTWAKTNVTVFAALLEDMYLYGDYRESIDNPSGRIIFIKIFSIVAIFIIILACMNYTNLATALAIKRAKEVGIKKVFGSDKAKMVFQFTLEALLLTVIAFFISLIIVEAALPFMKNLTGREIPLDYKNVDNLKWFVLVPLITGIIAGVFPAFYLSSFKPVQVLKSVFRPSGSMNIRHILVVFQFVITIAFIISSFVILKQIKYIQNKTLGLEKENVIFFGQTLQIIKQRASFKEELKKQAGVINVTYTDSNPLEVSSSTTDPYWRGKPEGQNFLFPYMEVDHDFVETLGVEVVEGRDFSEKYPNDVNALIINQEAVKIMQLKNPIGEVVNYWGRKATIVGVVKDFHIGNLRMPIKQLIITCRPEATRMVMVRIAANDQKNTLKNIEKVFRNFESNVPFEYEFLDKQYEKNYESEKYMSKFSNVFAILAIIISCLGLLGLALFTAEQKTKEIGIRKSMGATNLQIMLLLGKDFMKWIVISFIIASLFAYYLLESWLSSFSYRTQIDWWIFAVTGGITAIIAIFTVSWQSWKAARKNPVESLRYE